MFRWAVNCFYMTVVLGQSNQYSNCCLSFTVEYRFHTKYSTLISASSSFIVPFLPNVLWLVSRNTSWHQCRIYHVRT